MSVIAPCRSNPKATVASPNPEHRIVQINYKGIREITQRPARCCHPLHPTIGPIAGNSPGRQPSAGAAGGSPKGEAQGIAKKLAALARAGGRPIGWTNANALAAKGNAGEDHGAGGVIGIGGNPHPGAAARGLVAQPVGEGGDLGGGPTPPPDRYRQWMGEPEKEAEQSRARQATAQQPKFQSTGQPTPGDVAGHLLRGDGGMHQKHHAGFI